MSANPERNFYAYTTIFNISSEEDIEDFWSYFIFRLNLENNENNYERFCRLYNLLNENKNLLSPSKYITISLKESTESFYLSVQTKIAAIIEKFIHKLESLAIPYRYEESILSYTIEKQTFQEGMTVQNNQDRRYAVYDFIDQDDLNDMQACISKMQDGNYNKVYVEEIASYYAACACYSGYLQRYPQLDVMSSCVSELCMLLSVYEDDCTELGIDFKRLLQSFINNIWHWQESLFVKGGEELHFMDDSFNADLSQIKMSLNIEKKAVEDADECLLDDIFNF